MTLCHLLISIQIHVSATEAQYLHLIRPYESEDEAIKASMKT